MELKIATSELANRGVGGRGPIPTATSTSTAGSPRRSRPGGRAGRRARLARAVKK
jgi:hypothetical protein